MLGLDEKVIAVMCFCIFLTILFADQFMHVTYLLI